MKSKLKYIVGAVVLAGALVGFTTDGKYFDIARNLDIFATLFKEVNAYYVDDIAPDVLIKPGIDAMLASLDPYTTFIPEEELESYRTMTTGLYGGIGAIIGNIADHTYVTMLYENYAAHKAGIRIGDQILSINGVEVKSKGTTDVTKLLKGDPNTLVEIKVKRQGVVEPIVYNFNREKIKIDNVPYFNMVNDNTGYIRLSDFTFGASREVAIALDELKQLGATKIVLDLRGNPGGLLNEAIDIANVFIPKGKEVVATKGKVEEWNKSYKSLNNPVDVHIPLAVLINGFSASASEIVAGVMQDYDRGILVGRKTFGKGLVQTTRPLTYNAQLKVTTAKYYIPSGRCIQRIDYSHKDMKGEANDIPDSLKSEFTTKNGRSVYDGGGLVPDFEVQSRYFSSVTAALISKGFIFLYANEYVYQNASIESADIFNLTDDEYTQFINWINKQNFEYTTRVEKEIQELEDQAKEEKFYASLKADIEHLKNSIKQNKEGDMIKFKDEIKLSLEQEIISRYYLSKGDIEASLVHDADVLRAVEVLDDNTLYNQTLQVN